MINEDLRYRMIDVSPKLPTQRYARAKGRILMSEEAFRAIVEGRIPKGDPLVLAEIAGIQAAKKASDNIPLCHPLSLDTVRVRCRPEASTCSVWVSCEASAFAKTGVEMEALAGVNGALLAIWDLTKAVDPALELSDVRLCRKEGGKSGLWLNPKEVAVEAPPASLPLAGVRAGVLTVSDRASAGTSEDVSGPTLVRLLEGLGASVVAREILPDDRARLAVRLREMSGESALQLLVTTGGTGAGPRDVTPEAVADACDRLLPGIGEALRATGAQQTARAWLSRSCAGLIGQTLVVALPGNPKAVEQAAGVLRDLVPHVLHVGHGGGHD